MDRAGERRVEEAPVSGSAAAWVGKVYPLVKPLMLICLALVLIGGGGYFVVARPDLMAFASWGYIGVAILIFLCSTTILLPAPGFLAVVAAGGVWNPLLVGIAGGIGGGLGEFSSYLLGLGGGSLAGLEKNTTWQMVHSVVQRHGFWAIVLAAALPAPFDVVGVIAGGAGYPALRFIVATVLGKTIKYLLLAYFGEAAFALWAGFA